MKRVKTLVNKLQNQLEAGADTLELLTTVKMLEVELATLANNSEGFTTVHIPQSKVFLNTELIDLFKEEDSEAHNQEPDVLSKPEEVSEKKFDWRIKSEKVEVLKQEAEIDHNPEPEQAESITINKEEIEPENIPEEERVFELLEIDEADIEAELEEIKKNAEALNNMSARSKPVIHFEPEDEIPTLLRHPEVIGNETKPIQGEIDFNQAKPSSVSLYEKLQQEKAGTNELSEKLTNTPIKDLKKAISINEKFVFVQALFRGDEDMYERSLRTINNFSIYPEAEYWIRRELKLKLGWNEKDEAVQKFENYVRRRFSSM